MHSRAYAMRLKAWQKDMRAQVYDDGYLLVISMWLNDHCKQHYLLSLLFDDDAMMMMMMMMM